MKNSIHLLQLVIVLVALSLMATGCQQQAVKISRLTILVSGETDGYLKNCGCMGGQVGGEVRKAYLLNKEKEEAVKPKPADKGLAAEVLLLELGNFIDGRQRPKEKAVQRLYSEGVIQSMMLQDYHSVGLGHNELVNGQQELYELIGDTGMKFTAANLSFAKPEQGEDYSSKLNALLQPYRVVKLPSGYRIGVIHVLDSTMTAVNRRQKGLQISDAIETVRRIQENKLSDADFWILTTAGLDDKGPAAKALAEVDSLSLIIGLRPANPLAKTGSSQFKLPIVTDGPFTKAKSLLRTTVQFREDDEFSIDSRQLSLGAKVKNDEHVTAIINELQPRLEQLEISQTEELLRNKGPHPWYEGHETCATCHQDIYEQLSESRHIEAYESLVRVSKQKNADCVSCHVTGHGTSSGWNVLDNQPEMQGVQCESCHGPGEFHAMVMSGGDLPENLTADGRNQFGLQEPDVKTCTGCHDTLNSSDFDFEVYWPKINHAQ